VSGIRRRVGQLRTGGDEGSVMLLIVVYFLIAATLVIVVTDAADVFIARRDLSALADGAATAGVQGADEAELYAAGAGAGDLALATPEVITAVTRYLAPRIKDDPSLGVTGLAINGRTVVVTVSADERLPLLGPLAQLVPGGGIVRISATARARAVVR
jgi:hypothetical protein